MKKLLLFFFALLTGVSGAWATTPNILALPQPGKIYYIAGYNSTQNKTAYLYADGTAVKGNISYTKAGDFAYLWLCAKTASGYTFQNLSTGKYIEGPFASGAATRAQLSDNATSYTFTQAVQDANCVSLCANNQWLVVSLTESKAVDRLSGSYNWYSSQWCSDFLLEEYAAKTLSHNQYYYMEMLIKHPFAARYTPLECRSLSSFSSFGSIILISSRSKKVFPVSGRFIIN